MSGNSQFLDDTPKQRVIGKRYKLSGEVLGKGASGTVYKALTIDTGVIVAVKELSLKSMSPAQLEAIMSEIDLLKSLNHPNIVKYLDFLRTKDSLFIILEFVESGSLAHMLKKFGSMQERLVAFYMRQVLEGLVYLHEQGVLHRDIKGANILATKDADIKVADFGVATKLRDAGNLSMSVVGTPYWMAPEVIEMNGALAASDIWSLGCTAIELLSGKPPYYSLPAMTALFQIVHDPHPPLPEGISPVFKDFLLQCFQKDPSQRPSARQMLRHPLMLSLRTQSYNDVMSNLRSQDTKRTSPKKRLTDIYEWREAPTSPRSDTGRESGLAGSGQSNKSIPPPASDSTTTGVLSGSGPRSKGSANAVISRNDIQLTVDDESGTGGSGGNAPASGAHRPFSPHTPGSDGGSLGSSFGDALDLGSDDGLDGIGSISPHDSMKRQVLAAARLSENNLGAYAEGDDDDLGLSFEGDDPAGLSALDLRGGLHENTQLAKRGRSGSDDDSDLFDDPFFDADFADVDPRIERDASKKRIQSEEVFRLIGCLTPETLQKEGQDTVLNACRRLVEIFRENPDQKSFLIQHAGVVAIMDMLEVQKQDVLSAVLEVVNEIIRDNAEFQENLCLVGSIPVIMKFCGSNTTNKKVRNEAAKFLRSMCHTSRITLQMFIACRGLPVLVEWLEPQYAEFRTLVHHGIDGVLRVFDLQSPTPKNDFCRLFAKSGLAPRLLRTLKNILGALDAENEDYLDKIANILLHCSNADSIVKGHFAQVDVLRDLFASVALAIANRPELVLKLVTSIRILSSDHTALENLQAAGMIPALVPYLDPERDLLHASRIHSQVMLSLFNITRFKRQRQEEAAVNGIIPYLQHYVRINSPLRQFALPMLCDMAHASQSTRTELAKHDGVEFYLDLLDQEYWQAKGLEALAAWASHDRERRVEAVLCRADAIERITGAVTTATDGGLLKLLEPIDTIITSSQKTNQALGSSGFIHNLIKRLSHPDALARLSLLKILRSFYEYSKEPKKMIAEYKLFQVVDGIARNDTSSVLVREVAEQLKRAFDANVLL